MNAERFGGKDTRRLVLDSYGRLSRVPETGELEKIETQFEDNRGKIERLDGKLGVELSDGLSAWKKGVRRPGWERLLERVQSGESDGIVVWHTDRLFRQPKDLEALIDLGETGFLVASAHGTRDLADPDDRFFLRIEVAHAARSSDDTQRRTKRRNAAMRAQGKRHVRGRGFGQPGQDRTIPANSGEDRPEVPKSQVNAEREAIRWGSEAWLAGVSLMTIAKTWNDQGLYGVTGTPWIPSSVRATLLRAINAGLIEYKGEIVGEAADMEPIVPREMWERVRAKAASRRSGRERASVFPYAATGLLHCGECGMKLSGRKGKGMYADGAERRQYFCPGNRHGCGKVVADMRAVDAELRKFTIARLSDARYAEAIAAALTEAEGQHAKIAAEIAECEQLQEDLAAKLGRRELTLKAFNLANAPLAKDLERLYAERDALAGSDPQGPAQARPAEMIAAEWDASGGPERRAMLTKALGELVMVVEKAGNRSGVRRAFDPGRVHLQRDEDGMRDAG